MIKFKELESPRDLTKQEYNILKALLFYDFPGVEELRIQAEKAKVLGEYGDNDPTIEFFVPRNLPAAKVNRRVPIEAEKILEISSDVETKLHILLHISNDGYLSELEFYADGDNNIIVLPDVKNLTIVCLDWISITRSL